uniref:Single domain-containing protein n=1 Tax=Amblyomma maculatum TaxID=34609 RepID=G3MT32_AMBMU
MVPSSWPMKLLWIVVASYKIAFSTRTQESAFDPSHGGVLRFEEGRCYYNGIHIATNMTARYTYPCVQAVCKAHRRRVILTGCPAPKGTRLNEPYVTAWPNCCGTT